MAFMLALVFIFEIVQREVESITKPQEGIVGARDLENGVSGQNVEESHMGHNVALPPEVTENGRPLDEVYAEVTGEPFLLTLSCRSPLAPTVRGWIPLST